MTVCVAVLVNDCVVFAADSASSLVVTDENGVSQILNVYQHGDKVYNLHRKLPVVAMTCGMGNIGSASISTHAKELRHQLMSGDPGLSIDPSNYTIQEIAVRAKALLDERYIALVPRPGGDHSLEFWIGGYSSSGADPEIWKITISNGECVPLTPLAIGGSGILWGGQTAPIHRLVVGYDASAVDVLKRNGVDPALAEAAGQLLRNELQASLVASTMPVRDAIELADFLAETTKRYFRFLPGADVVGGDTDIAVVTKYEGFKWIRRKHFYSPALNPKDVDHV